MFRGKGLKTRLMSPLDTFWDHKLGISTWRGAESNVEDGLGCVSASYRILKNAMDLLEVSPNDVFFDLGCGLGRPLFLVQYLYSPAECIGIEANSLLVDLANDNVASFKYRKDNIKIVHALAQDIDYSRATIVYMYNPFGRKTIADVLEKIKQSLFSTPRKVSIIYLNPINNDVLRECDWLEEIGQLEKRYGLQVGQHQSISAVLYRSKI